MDTPQQPDTRPGAYFVSGIHDAKGMVLLVGPFFNDHAGALALVNAAKAYICQHWPRYHFEVAFGTVRLPADTKEIGRLNSALNFNPVTP